MTPDLSHREESGHDLHKPQELHELGHAAFEALREWDVRPGASGEVADPMTLSRASSLPSSGCTRIQCTPPSHSTAPVPNALPGPLAPPPGQHRLLICPVLRLPNCPPQRHAGRTVKVAAHAFPSVAPPASSVCVFCKYSGQKLAKIVLVKPNL